MAYNSAKSAALPKPYRYLFKPRVLMAVLAILSALVAFRNIDFESEKVTGDYIATYLRSQDINFDVKPRAHISDEHIYVASGFLYATGSSPTEYNFQHPPLIKYLFGISAIHLGSAMWVQYAFAVALPLLTYLLGMKIFKSNFVGFMGSIFLIFDPLFINLSRHALLDLGQATFAVSYVLVSLCFPKRPAVSGMLLGLFAASKFYSPAIVYFLAVEALLFITNKKIDAKRILITLASSFLVFNLIYIQAYLKVGRFNIMFWQAKIIKYMLHHDAAASVGASIVLFMTGSFKNWWGRGPSRDTWSLLWPTAFLVNLVNILRSTHIDKKMFIFAFPVLYLISLSAQAPFSRYFILVMPFLYLGTAFGLRSLLAQAINSSNK